MPKSLVITDELLAALYDHNILPKFNSAPPDKGRYGWMHAGDVLTFHQSVTIEENVGIYGGAYKGFPGGLKSHGFASVGSFTYSFSALPEPLTVGRYCSISKGLGFLDSAHPLDTLTSSAAMFRPNNQLFSTVQTEEVRAFSKGFSVTPPAFPVIGNDVWIGANVTLAPKITIGTGAVIAADSVVTKDVAPYEIVGGNPAKHIRMRFPEERVQALLESQWWEYEPSQVFSNDPRDIDSILERIDAGHIDRYEPRSITLDPQDPALQPKPAGSKPNSTRSKPRTVGQKIAKKILRRARNSWGGDRYRR